MCSTSKQNGYIAQIKEAKKQVSPTSQEYSSQQAKSDRKQSKLEHEGIQNLSE
jgi:hypothetical protein